MEEAELDLTLTYLVIAVLAIIMNSILIFLASRVPRRPGEVNLVILLAVVDMILPIFAIGAITMKMSSENNDFMEGACQIKGSVDYIGMYTSVLLVSIIAFSRVNRVVNIKYYNSVIIFLGLYSLVFIGIMVAAAANEKFYLLPNGIDCTTDTKEDLLSAIAIVFVCFSLIMFLLITLSSYLSLIFVVLPDSNDGTIPLQSRSLSNLNNKHPPIPRSSRISIAIRTAIVCITYFAIIAPACVLLIIESVIEFEVPPTILTMIDVCIASIALVNPCLVLFTHSLIYAQLQGVFYAIMYPCRS